MAKAIWNGQTLAESDKVETIEGNVYFPDESVKREFFKASSTTSSCTWKGQARYYTLVVDGQEILNYARQSIPFHRPRSLNSGPKINTADRLPSSTSGFASAGSAIISTRILAVWDRSSRTTFDHGP